MSFSYMKGIANGTVSNGEGGEGKVGYLVIHFHLFCLWATYKKAMKESYSLRKLELYIQEN